MNRWFRVAGGVAMNLCFGAAYAFSIFLAPLQREFGWTRAQVSLAFTLSIAFIAVGVLTGGRWHDRRGPAPADPAPILPDSRRRRPERRRPGRREDQRRAGSKFFRSPCQQR